MNEEKIKELREHWYYIVKSVFTAEATVGMKLLKQAKKAKTKDEVNKLCDEHIYKVVDEILSKTDLTELS